MQPQIRVRRGISTGDPFWTSVSLLVINETGKTDGNTVFIDQSQYRHTVTTVGDARWVTAQSYNTVMGASCLCEPFVGSSTDSLQIPTHPAFNFGTANCTVEGFVRLVNYTQNPVMCDFRDAEPQVAPAPYILTDGTFRLYVNGADVITGTTVISATTWHHLAWSRVNGISRIFLDGIQEGSNYADTNNYAQRLVTVGARWDFVNNQVNGHLSNVRITLAGRYASAFTPPTPPFPTS